MKKVLALTFITFAIAALVTGMTVITTQIVNAENDFGKAVSGIARDTDAMGLTWGNLNVTQVRWSWR
jgi:hypothetical protein